MNKSGAETNSIPTHVAAGIEVVSEIIPAKIAPTIPPISKTIDNSALPSGVNVAKSKSNDTNDNLSQTTTYTPNKLTSILNIQWQPKKECVVDQFRKE